MYDIPGAGAWAACFLAVGYVVAESASGAASLSHTIGLAIGTAAVVGALVVRVVQLYRTHPAGVAPPRRAALAARRADSREVRQAREPAPEIP